MFRRNNYGNEGGEYFWEDKGTGQEILDWMSIGKLKQCKEQSFDL